MRIPVPILRATFRLVFPFTPKSLRLPLRYKLTELEGTGEPELIHLDRILQGRGTALDIGANIGMYSYRLSPLVNRVVSFEINDEETHELAAWNPGNIEMVPKGLSSAEGQATLHIPVLNGRKLTGWASLAPGNCPDTDEHVTKPVHIVPLDSYAVEGVTFIKMDVEGHELEVLRGARETLTTNRPVMLIEIREENLAAIREFLGELGYRETTMKDLAGHEGQAGNYFFVPAEVAQAA